MPFVGCPADGQGGPIAAPRTCATPLVEQSAARRLAYYCTDSPDDMGVLAPRGWHCLALYGSNGSSMVVAPEARTFAEIVDHGVGAGPAVQLSGTIGSTSGRMTVDRVIARLFRQHIGWVRHNVAESLDSGPMPNGPYQSDRLVRRGSNAVDFTTPAGRRGSGTESYLSPGTEPIRGFHRLLPDEDMELTSLFVRLPRAQSDLTSAIIEGTRRLNGR